MSGLAQRRPRFSKRLIHLTLALALTAMAGIATAKPDNITEAEMKLLPRYCPDTQSFKYGDAYSNTSPRAGYWVGLMGNSFWAMHHYCWALINMNRARKAGVPAQQRQGLWESARGDYGYVINNTPPDFIMLPEIYTRIGEVELLLGRPDRANEAFARARALKPDYWPAYSRWAEFLMGIGRRPDALKVVTAGLEHAPEAKGLLELFRVLGGKRSDLPKPPAKPQTATEPEMPKEALKEAPKETPSADVTRDEE